MANKEKRKSKEKKPSKSKTMVKGKSKEKSEMRAKAAVGMARLMPQKVQKSYRKRRGLSTFFAEAAKKKIAKEKKIAPTRSQVISDYRKQEAVLSDYQAEKEKQLIIRFTPSIIATQSTYSKWRNEQSNSHQYPKNKEAFMLNWKKSKNPKVEKPELWEDSGDGRIAGVRNPEKVGYAGAQEEIETMREKYVYLSALKSEPREVKGTPKQIEGQTELGITPINKTIKDEDGNELEIEITHVFNYPPSSKPIYKNPVLVELAKNPTPNSRFVLSKYGSQASLEHPGSLSDTEKDQLIEIVRRNGWIYNRYGYEASLYNYKENESKIAKTIQELRRAGFKVAISPEYPAPDPDSVVEVEGDERFDIIIDVDRTSFRSNVTGERAVEFLQEMDTDTASDMARDDKIAYIKEHKTAIPLIRQYKKNMKAQGKKLILDDGTNMTDVFIMDKLLHLLPHDKKWHFVNYEDQTIPIGFVYHYALDKKDYNLKIIDNRPLYLVERTPAKINYVDKDGNVFELRDYQRDAIDSAVDRKSGIVSAATGSGKTEIGAFIIAEQGLDAVWFAHRKELIDQAEKRMEKRLGMDVGIYGSDRKEIVSTPDMDINVITTRSASMIMRVPRKEYVENINKINKDIQLRERQISSEPDRQKKPLLAKDMDKLRSQLVREKMKLEIYDFIDGSKVQVFDESHHMTALEFGDIARATPQSRYRYGLSATPFGNTTTSQRRIEALMGDKIVDISASKLIDEGYLAKPNILMVKLPHLIKFPYTKIDKNEHGVITNVTVYTSEKDMNSHAINKAAVVRNEEFNDYIVDFSLQSRKTGLNTLILVQEVEHGKLIQDKFEEKGLTVDFLTATNVSDTNQKAYLERFRERKTDTLIATIGKAGEGVDIPYLDTVVLAHGGKSTVQTMQRIGRGMRIPKGSDKKESVVIDFDREEKYIGRAAGSVKAHDNERRKIYGYEKRFEVINTDIEDVDKELLTVARLNQAKPRADPTITDEDAFLFEEKRFQTREQIQQQKLTEDTVEAMEQRGTIKKMGKKADQEKYSLIISDEAKKIAKQTPAFKSDILTKTGKPKKARLTAIHIQHLLNNFHLRGIDPQTLDWGTLDNSLTVDEALGEWEKREVKGIGR